MAAPLAIPPALAAQLQTQRPPMILWVGAASGLVVVSMCILAMAVGVVFWSRDGGKKADDKDGKVEPKTDPGLAKEPEPLRGSWVVTEVEPPGRNFDVRRLVFTGEVITAVFDDGKKGKETKQFKFKIDATAKPALLILFEGDGGDDQWLYEINGDTLRICVSTNYREHLRPTEFKATLDNAVVTLKREKKTTPGPTVDDKKEKATQPKAYKPTVFIDEDFRTAFDNKLKVPEGWTHGEEFRIVKVKDQLCLEQSTPYQKNRFSPAYVMLPPVKLRGNFYIEGICSPDVRFRLVQANNLTPIDIYLVEDGGVWLQYEPEGSITKGSSPSYKPGLPTRFLLTRKGNQMSVQLNDDVAGVRDFAVVREITSIELNMFQDPPVETARRGPARLYRLKVGTLPP